MAKHGKPEKITHVGASQADSAAATHNAKQLSANSVYPGKVRSIDPMTRKLSVKTDLGIVVEDCILMSDSLAAVMGFEQLGMPAVGTRVIMLYTPTKSYVVCGSAVNVGSPDTYSVPAGGYMDTCTLEDGSLGVRRSKNSKSVAGGGTPARDLVPGEKEYTNNLGIWLRLLTNFAQMSAGELAKIEVGLINDMVRIVDNYFVHHNVGGDTMIWSAGKCNYESHFTSYPHEAEGKLKPSDKLAEEIADGVMDPEKSVKSPASSTGRWRKSTYFGFLGDMIHTWITDPTAALSTYGEGAARAGKYRCWVGSDGQLMVQSVSGVHIEVTPRVIVPEVNYNWNDPDFDMEQALKDFDTKFLQLWATPNKNWADMQVACWQMRDWAKYITHWHSLARWRGLEESGYCKVDIDEDVVPDPTCKEEDKGSVNAEAKDKPYDGKAIFSMDPSGSISVIAYGTKAYAGTASVILNQGNVQIAASGNLELECAGTLSLKAKDIALCANRNIQFEAWGRMFMYALRSLKALVTHGTLWLKSDGKPESPVPDYKNGPNLYPGVKIDAPYGGVLINGNKEVCVRTEDEAANIYMNTLGKNSGVCTNTSFVHTKATGQVLTHATTFGVSAPMTEIKGSDFRAINTLRVTPTGVESRNLVRAEQVTSNQTFMSNGGTFVANPQEDKRDTLIPQVDAEAYDAVDERLEALNTNEDLTKVSKTVTDYFNADLCTNLTVPTASGEDYSASSWVSYKVPPYVDEWLAGNSETGSMRGITAKPHELINAARRTEISKTGTGLFPRMIEIVSEHPYAFRSSSESPSATDESKIYDYEAGTGGLNDMEKQQFKFYVHN